MPLAHFSKVGGSGIWTPDLLRGRPERIPLHHSIEIGLKTWNFHVSISFRSLTNWGVIYHTSCGQYVGVATFFITRARTGRKSMEIGLEGQESSIRGSICIVPHKTGSKWSALIHMDDNKF